MAQKFVGGKHSKFRTNRTVQALIIADTFIWSAWNFVTPIFAIFVVQDVVGGTAANAAFGFSIYLVVRVLFELLTGRYLSNEKRQAEVNKIIAVFIGIVTVSIAYLGFSNTTTIWMLYLFYALLGIGMGTAAPARMSLFTEHIDRSEDTLEWGVLDASVFMGMAIAGAIGGIIAEVFGFQTLFTIAATLNILSIIPYIIYSKKKHYSFFRRKKVYKGLRPA